MTARACRERSRMLGAYLDGALEGERLVEMDEHVGGCEVCREEAQLLCAMRGSLKRRVKAAAPQGMRERIAGAMAAEQTREDAARDTGGRAAVWQAVVPLATAAAVALAWGLAAKSDARPSASQASLVGNDDLLSELVNEHRWPMPPETTDPKAVRGFERYVGVPVRPSNFERVGAHLVGGRVLPTPHAQRAAMLQYEVGTGDNVRRVSVLVYDAQKIQVGTANLAPREIGTTEVRVGRENGFSVAATERGGVGYLLASDLDPDKSAQLAAMVLDDSR
ncbi:MAG TPA: zf-HC2 domain-containing protein [Polyangiaceae bacterium]